MTVFVYALRAYGSKTYTYIGQSNDVHTRFLKHKNLAAHGKADIHRWMRYIGIDEIEYVVLDSCDTKAKALERESQWIIALLETGHYLLNEVYRGGTRKAETINKIANSNRGQKRPRSSELLRGIPKPEKTRQRISATLTGRKQPWNTKEANSEAAEKRRNTLKANPRKYELTGKARHVRWHANRNIIKSDCAYCVQNTEKDIETT